MVLLRLLRGLHSGVLLETVLKLPWSYSWGCPRRSHGLGCPWTDAHDHGRRLGRLSRVLLMLHCACSGRAGERLMLKMG